MLTTPLKQVAIYFNAFRRRLLCRSQSVRSDLSTSSDRSHWGWAHQSFIVSALNLSLPKRFKSLPQMLLFLLLFHCPGDFRLLLLTSKVQLQTSTAFRLGHIRTKTGVERCSTAAPPPLATTTKRYNILGLGDWDTYHGWKYNGRAVPKSHRCE